MIVAWKAYHSTCISPVVWKSSMGLKDCMERFIIYSLYLEMLSYIKSTITTPEVPQKYTDFLQFFGPQFLQELKISETSLILQRLLTRKLTPIKHRLSAVTIFAKNPF